MFMICLQKPSPSMLANCHLSQRKKLPIPEDGELEKHELHHNKGAGGGGQNQFTGLGGNGADPLQSMVWLRRVSADSW